MHEKKRVPISALRQFFQNDTNIILATLFGSSANGSINPGSDIDVAILYDDPPDPMEEYEDYYLRLCDVTEDIAPISLVNLNTAEPILAFEALSGRIICKNDPQKAAGFQSLVSREYEDVMANVEYQRNLPTEKSRETT